MKYRLINNFDVWGNEEDGWQVNDATVIREVEISENITDEEIIQMMYDEELISTKEDIAVKNNGDNFDIIVNSTEYPLYSFQRIYS